MKKAKKITDRERLDWLLTPGHDLGVRDLKAKYQGMLWFDTRREIDLAIRASKRGK